MGGYVIPDNIVINGVKIQVLFNGSLDSHDEYGRYLPDKFIIEIDPMLPDEKKRMVLIHEIIEAINNIYDIGLKHHQINLLEAGLSSMELFR
jgi:hypothetical protein